MIRLAFRLDDPSETSHQGVEAAIVESLRQHRACATFAIIPFRLVEGRRVALSIARAQPLIDAAHAGIIEPALHGNMHIRREAEPAPATEFSGRPMAEQRELIEQGKNHLEATFGMPVRGFVPPWNSYDLATVEALESCNFDYLSAGRAFPDYDGTLKILPRTARLSELRDAVHEARRFRSANPVIVCIMHHYDFVESGEKDASADLATFSGTLAWLREQSDVSLHCLADIADSIRQPSRLGRHYRFGLRHARLRRFFPEFSFLDASAAIVMLTAARFPHVASDRE